MTPQDREAIEELFTKVDEVARRSGPRDPEAEALINRAMSAIPGAAYYMAQTVVMQQLALQQAEQRLEQLESQSRPSRGGGFLDSLFGDGGRSAPGRSVGRPRGPWGDQQQEDGYGRRGGMGYGGGFGGGGFLAGAAQTAMGVAGGVLLGNAIAGMFDTDVQAAEYGGEAGADAGDAGGDTGGDDFGGGEDFGGGDFGGGGEF